MVNKDVYLALFSFVIRTAALIIHDVHKLRTIQH